MKKNMTIQDYIDAFSEEDIMFDDLSFSVISSIHIFMHENKINQKKLAEKLGMTEARISKMLSGDANLTLRTIAKVCVAINAQVHLTLSRKGDQCTWVKQNNNIFTPSNWSEQQSIRSGEYDNVPNAA